MKPHYRWSALLNRPMFVGFREKDADGKWKYIHHNDGSRSGFFG
jgi:hypothetical protein